MITVILKGGLGNNLFQYALGKYLAVKNNTTVRLDLERYANRYDILGWKARRRLASFHIEPVLYTAILRKRLGRRFGVQFSSNNDMVYHEERWGYCPEAQALKDGAYLDGYFQSEKYFKDIEQEIRNDLRFRKNAFGGEGVIYKERIMGLNSVGVHIRRGDYLIHEVLNICNSRYYAKSIAHMRDRLKSPHFFIFSDDLGWCRKNIDASDCSFVNIRASEKNPAIDLQLMSLCKHNIISNSTFSWWAAWLNENHEKIVISPYRWFNDESYNVRALQDTIPDSWELMDF